MGVYIYTHTHKYIKPEMDVRVRIDELTSCTCSRVDVESTIATHTYSMYVIEYLSTSCTQHTYSIFVIHYLSTVARTHTVCMSYSIVCTRRTDKDRVLALFELKASYTSSLRPHTQVAQGLFDVPTKTEYWRSSYAKILTLMVGGAKAVISFSIRSGRPLYIVVPTSIIYM